MDRLKCSTVCCETRNPGSTIYRRIHPPFSAIPSIIDRNTVNAKGSRINLAPSSIHGGIRRALESHRANSTAFQLGFPRFPIAALARRVTNDRLTRVDARPLLTRWRHNNNKQLQPFAGPHPNETKASTTRIAFHRRNEACAWHLFVDEGTVELVVSQSVTAC